MNGRLIKTGYKLGFAALGMSAIITEIVVLIGEGVFDPGNFFSFFTIQSNILAVIVLVVGGLMAASARKSRRFGFFRGATTFYMAVTGLVFAVLLSSLEGIRLTATPWDNIVLHYIIPMVMVADWLLDPPARRIGMKKAILWLTYPLAYFVYSLVRGEIVNWYPYPFINPTTRGYVMVFITAAALTVAGIGLVWLFSKIGRKA